MKITKRIIVLLMAASLALGCVQPALADGYGTMYVRTGNSGRLNLRALPSVQSTSLGLYANGTPVTVHSIQSGWAYVTVQGMNGYMLFNCLTASVPPQPVPSSNPWAVASPVPTEDTTMYVSTGNTGKLHLREQPTTSSRSLGLFPNGTTVQVTARVGNFAFVKVGSQTGYMMQIYLSPFGPASTTPPPAPATTPPPFNPGAAVAMVVRTGNTGKLHLREAPSTSSRSLGLYPNGTTLLAVLLGNGWARVQVNGAEGYMMTGFLAELITPTPTPTPDPALPTPTPTPTPGPSTDVTMVIATGNSGKLHLRENVSTSSASLGLYPNGTLVTVHGAIGNWYAVTVNGKNGYMMRQFLSPVAAPSPTPVGYTPTPIPAPGIYTVTQPNNSFVNLRAYPNSEADNVIAKLPSGTQVEMLEKGETWCKIRVNGMEGWIISWYLK